MQESFQFSGYFNGKSGIAHKTVALTFGISFACHAVLIGILFFLPGYSRPVFNPFPSSINVSLVSLPAGSKEPPAGRPDAIKKAVLVEKKAVKQAPVKKIEKQKTISKPVVKEKKVIKPVKKIEQKPVKNVSKAVSLNPKTSKNKKVDSGELIKKAIKDMEKRVEDSRPSSVDEAISKIRNRIDSGDSTAKVKGTDQVKGFGSQTGAIKGAFPGISGGRGGSNLPIGVFDVYKAEIFYTIQQNWAYSEQIGGRGSDEMVVLVIKIMHNGEISDVRFESRSKNRYLDESAYRAIQKSNPLPPLPEGYNRPYYEIGLRFGTSGLKRN